eukprot:351099-Chlamydomonas_euryale.AAC.6
MCLTPCTYIAAATGAHTWCKLKAEIAPHAGATSRQRHRHPVEREQRRRRRRPRAAERRRRVVAVQGLSTHDARKAGRHLRLRREKSVAKKSEDEGCGGVWLAQGRWFYRPGVRVSTLHRAARGSKLPSQKRR